MNTVSHILDDSTMCRSRVPAPARVPQLVVLALLGCGWCITTFTAWWTILFTGRYPAAFYGFGVGVLRWTTRVEAYLLLLRDEYPPFSLE